MKLWHAYVAIGVIGLVVAGSQALGYYADGLTGVTVDFWRDALQGNDVGRFLALDVVFLAAACYVLIWIEGSRLGIGVWWRVGYIVASTLVAASAFVPFFLAHRQRVLDARERAH